MIVKPNIEKLMAKGDVKGLIKALRHKDPETAGRAAGALADLGQPEAVPALIGALSQRDNGYLQEAAANALGWMAAHGSLEGSARDDAADALAEIAGNWNEDPNLGSIAACSLAACGDERAVEPLRGLLVAESAPVRYPGDEVLRLSQGSAPLYRALHELDHVLVTIRISTPIQGSRQFEGEYRAALPLEVEGPQLLGAIANSVIWPGQDRVYTGFSLECPEGTLSSAPGKGSATLKEAGVKDEDVLELSDTGGTFVGERQIVP